MNSTSVDEDEYFCAVPNWIVDHPDAGEEDWATYLVLRRRINYHHETGLDLSQDELAAMMGRRRETANRRIGRLERLHRQHRIAESCPDDGTCRQALVKRPNLRHGRNAWVTYFLDITKAQVAKLCDETHIVSPGRTQSAPQPVDNSTRDGASDQTTMPETTPTLCGSTHSRCDAKSTAAVTPDAPREKNKITRTKAQEHRTTGDTAQAPHRVDDESPGCLLDEARNALHDHLVERAVAFGVPMSRTKTAIGWRRVHWRGWNVDPAAVWSAIDYVYGAETKACDLFWRGAIGHGGVRGLRANWCKVRLAHLNATGAIDSAERAEIGGFEPWARDRDTA